MLIIFVLILVENVIVIDLCLNFPSCLSNLVFRVDQNQESSYPCLIGMVGHIVNNFDLEYLNSDSILERLKWIILTKSSGLGWFCMN